MDENNSFNQVTPHQAIDISDLLYPGSRELLIFLNSPRFKFFPVSSPNRPFIYNESLRERDADRLSQYQHNIEPRWLTEVTIKNSRRYQIKSDAKVEEINLKSLGKVKVYNVLDVAGFSRYTKRETDMLSKYRTAYPELNQLPVTESLYISKLKFVEYLGKIAPIAIYDPVTGSGFIPHNTCFMVQSEYLSALCEINTTHCCMQLFPTLSATITNSDVQSKEFKSAVLQSTLLAKITAVKGLKKAKITNRAYSKLVEKLYQRDIQRLQAIDPDAVEFVNSKHNQSQLLDYFLAVKVQQKKQKIIKSHQKIVTSFSATSKPSISKSIKPKI